MYFFCCARKQTSAESNGNDVTFNSNFDWLKSFLKNHSDKTDEVAQKRPSVLNIT